MVTTAFQPVGKSPNSGSQSEKAYWHFVLELKSSTSTTVSRTDAKLKILVLGRNVPSSGLTNVDIDLHPYGQEKNGVSRAHLAISPEEKKLKVFPGSTNRTYWDDVELLPGKEYMLGEGRINIGEVQIEVKYVDSIPNNTIFHLKLKRYGKIVTMSKERPGSSADNDAHEFTIVGGVEYPKWIVERAFKAIERTSASWEQAINAVLEFDVAKRHSVLAKTDDSVEAVFSGHFFTQGEEGSKESEE